MPERRKPPLWSLVGMLSSPLKYLSSCPILRSVSQRAERDLPEGRGPLTGCGRPRRASLWGGTLSLLFRSWNHQLCSFTTKGVYSAYHLPSHVFVPSSVMSTTMCQARSCTLTQQGWKTVPGSLPSRCWKSENWLWKSLNLTLTPCPDLPRNTNLLSLPQLLIKYLASAHLRGLALLPDFEGKNKNRTPFDCFLTMVFRPGQLLQI